jgi:hypothetical protein
MEQDLAFFDVRKTGKLMTILNTNVSSIQNVLIGDTADLCERPTHPPPPHLDILDAGSLFRI